MKTVLLIIGIICFTGGAVIGDTLTPQFQTYESSLHFSHRLHVEDQEIECLTCHPTVEESELSSDKNFPTMEECATCHDVEDDENCGMCHKVADEPEELPNPVREEKFNHKKHLDMGIECITCHAKIPASEGPAVENLPTMKTCFTCHNNKKAPQDCNLCHQTILSINDIHPTDWKNTHGDEANTNPLYCSNCHTGQTSCIDCHRGDNLTGTIHDLNYFFTHGLDAKSDQKDCRRCHDTQMFCVSCHEQNLRMPLNHSKLNWRTAHGQAAKTDIENCAACHDTDDPTCARSGCHNDFDGIKMTDPSIHAEDAGQFNYHGPWHNDDGYFCYQCHVPTRNSSTGFCTYCHEPRSGD